MKSSWSSWSKTAILAPQVNFIQGIFMLKDVLNSSFGSQKQEVKVDLEAQLWSSWRLGLCQGRTEQCGRCTELPSCAVEF